MGIKTLGALRYLLLENGNEINIGGCIRISNAGENSDIDIHYMDYLIAWFPRHLSADTEISNETFLSWDATFRKKIEGGGVEKILNDQLVEKDKIIEEHKKEIIGLETTIEKNKISVGKVEAYEKLLIGRQVTISK